MSIYSEMLRMVLETSPPGPDRPIGELIADLLARRSAAVAPPGSAARRGTPVAERIGDSLAYDAALARLCNHLGIDHQLTGESAGPVARERAEERLFERMPSLAAALEDSPPAMPGQNQKRIGGPVPRSR